MHTYRLQSLCSWRVGSATESDLDPEYLQPMFFFFQLPLFSLALLPFRYCFPLNLALLYGLLDYNIIYLICGVGYKGFEVHVLLQAGMVDLAGVRLHDINFPGFKNKKIKLQKPLQILDGLSN